MKTRRVLGIVLVLLLVVGLSAPALARKKNSFKAELDGFQETPAISTTGTGEFRARISKDEDSIDFELTYSGLEGGAVTAAHIHLGQAGVAGGVSAFLCGGGGKPACPASGTVEATIVASDVIGPAGQGIAAGELDELVAAIRDGVTYANVHTTTFPTGEIRGRIK
jgi:hypothetical protein